MLFQNATWNRYVTALSAQFTKYAFVGLFVNAVAYSVYLLITWQGVGHKTAMTGIFIFAVSASFMGNKKLTFGHEGAYRKTYARFWAVYGGCYVFNYCTMYVAVDLSGYKHQLVQLGLIVFDAPVVFLLQKFVVFRHDQTSWLERGPRLFARTVDTNAVENPESEPPPVR